MGSLCGVFLRMGQERVTFRRGNRYKYDSVGYKHEEQQGQEKHRQFPCLSLCHTASTSQKISGHWTMNQQSKSMKVLFQVIGSRLSMYPWSLIIFQEPQQLNFSCVFIIDGGILECPQTFFKKTTLCPVIGIVIEFTNFKVG